MKLGASIFVALCLVSVVVGKVFYLPGVAPHDFVTGEPVALKVNKLTSIHTQLPYKYYEFDLFCKPENPEDKVENLGEILRGDRIESSTFEIFAKEDSPKTCQFLCEKTYDAEKIKQLASFVADEYKVHWIVDNLPAATPQTKEIGGDGATVYYESGFAVGQKGDGESPETIHYLNNHFDIVLKYHSGENGDPDSFRIVGFEVTPQSYNYKDAKTCTLESETEKLALSLGGKDQLTVPFTYRVRWEESDVEWSSRWEKYLINTDPQIHWFSIINSLMIVLFLTGMVAMIMMRTLHADFKRYNTPADGENELEETGWKMVHGDVFRPPERPLGLAVLVGSGTQVFGMTLVTLMFAVLGLLSPANRGALMTAGLVLFVVMGIFGGYTAVRTYKMFKGTNWKKCALLTATVIPGIMFGIFFVLNMVIWGQRSSGAVPFGTLVALVALWFGISLPLCFLGGYFAFKKPTPEPPVRTNQIPRQIPEQVWYMHPIFSILMGGILPFGAVFIELFFILTAIWGHQFYYIFGFLFIVFIILILTCAEITIVMCYFQLCSEDYHWWWRSFLTAGASAFYMFLYSIFYFVTKSQITRFVSGLLYFGYTLIMTAAFFALTGTIGYFATYLFVVKIYSQLKVA